MMSLRSDNYLMYSLTCSIRKRNHMKFIVVYDQIKYVIYGNFDRSSRGLLVWLESLFREVYFLYKSCFLIETSVYTRTLFYIRTLRYVLRTKETGRHNQTRAWWLVLVSSTYSTFQWECAVVRSLEHVLLG